jgi:flagellar protein FlaI
VSRPGFGGSKTGEVTMFSLLKEAFRQNPQYIIVGEVRGEEANVMFQAMASGMTAMSTMHAGSADDALRRLQTRPIMLPPTLMETLDVVMVMCHAREKGANARRVKEMVEIEGVEKTGHVNVNRVFEWEPRTDVFKSADSKLLQRIADEKGFSMDYVMNDIADRKAFIQWLIQKAFDWRTITEYINLYHKDKISAIGIMKGSVNPEQVFAAKQETQPTPEQMEAFVAGVSPIVKQASAEPEKQVAAESREEEI